jgi:hypothetical protein
MTGWMVAIDYYIPPGNYLQIIDCYIMLGKIEMVKEVHIHDACTLDNVVDNLNLGCKSYVS